MIVKCPHCQAPLPTDGKQPGESLHHARCGNWVLLARWPSGAWYGVKVQAPRIKDERTKRDA